VGVPIKSGEVRVNFPLTLTLSRQGRENKTRRFFASLRMANDGRLIMIDGI
jgi:hypothetical protein